MKGKKKTTLQDIAELAGVTKMTVSKALRNQDGVSDSVKAKILKIARELQYDGIAPKYLRNSRTRRIAVLVPEVFMETEEIFYTSIFKYLYAEAIKRDYYLILHIVTRQDEQKMALPSICCPDMADGIIVLGQLPLRYVKKIKDAQMPTVLLDFDYTDLGLDCICTDNIGGMYQATRYLIEKGHKKIGFVGNVELTNSIRDRYLGYYRAMMENGIAIDKRFIVQEKDNNSNDIEIRLPAELPTAFVCNSDQAAFRLVEVLEQNNYRIPQDVSIIGFDDTLYSITCHPKLTTVRVNRKSMAETAVTMILELLEESSLMPRKVIISTSIVDRDSVGKPRA